MANNEWNQAIVNGAIDLFIEAVRAFNESDILKYTWPQYIRHAQTLKDTAFSSFIIDLKQRLAHERVIVTPEGETREPCTLRYLPEMFWRKDTRVPLLTKSNGTSGFVLNEYSKEDMAALNIREISSEDFVDMLRAFVKKEPRLFREESDGWHSQLARAVIDAKIDQKIRDLQIVPLEGADVTAGHWITTSRDADQKIYLPDDPDKFSSLQLPVGIDISIIASTAAQDKHRRALYEKFGAEVLSSRAAGSLVVRMHSDIRSDIVSENFTVSGIVSHARFLFKLSREYNISELSKIRLVTTNYLLHPGSQLYMDDPRNGFKLTQMFRQDDKIQFLHPDYLTCAPNDEQEAWLRWLQDSLGVRTAPPLTGRNGDLSEDLQWILVEHSSKEWLNLFRHCWHLYRDEIDLAENSKVRIAISEAHVVCRDGGKRPLREVYFPTKDVLQLPFAAELAPLIDIDNPDAWADLRILSLKLVPDGEFYLTLLKSFQANPSIEYTTAHVVSLYKEICRVFEKGTAPGIRYVIPTRKSCKAIVT